MVIIPEEYFKELEAIGEKKVYPEKTIVFMQEDAADEIYLIESGRVRVYIPGIDGKDTTLQILKKGRIFGDASFVADSVRSVNIEAVVPTTIVVIRTMDMIPALHRNEELMTLLFQHLTETCNTLTHSIARMVYCNSEQKVADFLLCSTSAESSTLPFSQQDLAETLGMNRVTVAKVLKKFREADAVETGYGTLRIKDRRYLKNLLPEGSLLRRMAG